MVDLAGVLLSPLSAAAQAAVIDAGNVRQWELLSLSPFLAPAQATRAVHLPYPARTAAALRRCDDREWVSVRANGQDYRSEHALRNPHVRRDVLTDALDSAERLRALAAWINPSTPVPARQARLTPERAHTLVGDKVTRAEADATELAHANPWLLDHTPVDAWPDAMLRGLATLPHLTAQQAERIATHSRVRQWAGIDATPALHGTPITDLTLDQLLDNPSPACQVAAANHPDLALNQALALLQSRGQATASGAITRICHRFGPLTVFAGLHAHGPGTLASMRARLATVAVHAPALATRDLHAHDEPDAVAVLEARQLATDLGDAADRWRMVLRMADGWPGSIAELVRASAHVTAAP